MTTNKKFWIGVWVIVISLLAMTWFGHAYAADCSYKFNQKETNQIIVMGEQLQQCKELTTLLEEQANLAQGAADSYAHALDAQERANKELKELMKLKDEKCKEDIDKAKPTFWSKLKNGAYGAIVGSLLTIIAIGAL